VVYAEAGGAYKTTMTANLAVAFERMGLNTLVIDLDPQQANLSTLFDVGEQRGDPDADNLVRHILDMAEGDFGDLIESTDEGVDIIPSHDMLSNFTSNLEGKINYEAEVMNISKEEYPRYELLYDLLWEKEKVQEEYDAVLIDPNARAEDLLYNAIYAVRTLIAPAKPAGKGNLSLDGLEELVKHMENRLDIEVGLSCVVPSGVSSTNAHKAYTEQFVNAETFGTPVVIGDRESLMDDMWEAKGSAFKVVEERWKTYTEDGEDEEGDQTKNIVSEGGLRRVRDREVETLRNLYVLARYVATETFDADVDPVLELDIEGKETLTFDTEAATVPGAKPS
jgi:cellulose biosynthesis protein BcsQ